MESKKYKRLLAWVLSLMLIVSGVSSPVATFAAEKNPTTKVTKAVTKYNLKFNITDKLTGDNIENPTIKVTYMEEDWDLGYEYEEEVTPSSDGTYAIYPGTEYTYTITKDKYVKIQRTITPKGDEANLVENIKMINQDAISPADQSAVDAAKKAFDKEYGALRPSCKDNVTNINDFVANKVNNYEGVQGVSVSVKTSNDTSYVGLDGKINYNKGELGGYTNVKNVSCTFVFSKGNAEAVTSSRTVTIGWDVAHFNSKIKEESDLLTADKIKGENADLTSVTKDLTLPQCMKSGLNKAWSVVDWTSSNTDVINLKAGSIDSKLYPLTGVVTPQEQDTEVTLTATFKANDSVLNTNVEKVGDFETQTKTFKVTVKGNGQAKPTEAELKAILDKYYTADLLTDIDTKEKLDTNNCQCDIQLPRYTKIKDENNNLVFKNREIEVKSSDESVIKITGYRANVDVFQKEDKVVNLTVLFTREGVTVEKVIPVKVIAITDERLDAEIALMEKAKANYFAGINDNQYKDKNNITGNLHAFAEMRVDEAGNIVWAYNVKDVKGTGIVPDDFFEDSVEMESAGYNKFKSSNNAVVQHDNLLVTRQDNTQEVTISSLLSSAKYGKFAVKHPENEKLQKLYKQEVSVTVKVKGTVDEKAGLKKSINSAKTFCDSIVEGTEGGQYKEGTKATLNAAITEAEKVLLNEEATTDEINNAIKALDKAAKDAKANRISKVVKVTVRANEVSLFEGVYKDLEVTSDLAEKYGYKKADEYAGEVTALDAAVAMHKYMYGEHFEKNPTEYLGVGPTGWITKMFGQETMNVGFTVNHLQPGMSLINQAVLKDNDIVELFVYCDPAWNDVVLYFEELSTKCQFGDDIELNLKSYQPMMGGNLLAEPNAKVALIDQSDKTVAEAVSDENGKVKFTNIPVGKYKAIVTEANHEYYFVPTAQVEVEEKEEITPAGYVYLCVEKGNIGQGYLLEPEKVPYYEGENVAQVLVRNLQDNGYEVDMTGSPEDSFYLSSINDTKGSTTATLPKFLEDYIKENNIDLANPRDSQWLGEFDYTNLSGWVFKYNDLHSPVGASGVPCENNMVIRWSFTVCGYGSDCWDTGWGDPIVPNTLNKDKLVKEIADFKASSNYDELIKDPLVKKVYDEMLANGTDNSINQTTIDNNLTAFEEAKTFASKTDEEKVKTIIDEINSIGEVDITKKGLINSIRLKYDSLTADQKKQISEETLKILTDAETRLLEVCKENAIAEIEGYKKIDKYFAEQQEEIKTIVEKYKKQINDLTSDNGIDECVVNAKSELDKVKEKTQITKDLIDGLGNKPGLDKRADYEKAQEAFDSLTQSEKRIVGRKYESKLKSAKNNIFSLQVKVYYTEIKEYKNLDDYRPEQKEEISKIVSSFTQGASKCKDLKSLDKFYADQKAEMDKIKTDAQLTKEENIADVVAKIDAIGTVTLESKGKIDAAREAYDKLAADDKAGVTNYDSLVAAEAKYKEIYDKAEADKKAVANVIGLIDEIGEVSLDSEAAINKARTAYDALEKELKDGVTNYETLTKAETKYAELVEQDKANKEAANKVTEKINALGTITLESKEALEEARKAYDALTDEQKALVTSLDKLLEGEIKYAELVEQDKANKEVAKVVIEKIDALGTITLESKEALEEARAAYDALTDDQKALVNNISVLTEAEKTYAKLVEDSKPQEPQQPVDPEKPGDTEKPVNPQKPADTQKPADQQKPVNTQKPEKEEKSAQTGDETPMALYASLMALAALGVSALYRRKTH